MDTKNKVFVVIGSIALVATAGLGGAYLFANKDTSAVGSTIGSSSSTNNSATSSTSTTPSISSATSNGSSNANSSYKDGTYTVTQSYSVPHGAQNSITAVVTVANGKITSVKTTDNYSDHESGMYISDFESSVSSTVTGTSLADASYSRIGGASLTTAAFDSALDSIRSQATA